MHCPAPICSDLTYLFLIYNSVHSVTDFPKQGKMEQVTAGCSSKMVVKIGAVYYRYFKALSGTYFQLPLYHTRQQFSTEITPCNRRAPFSFFIITPPGTSSGSQASRLWSFPVPSWQRSVPPSGPSHSGHPPVPDGCMCSWSLRCPNGPSSTAVSLDSCRRVPCCCSRYGGRHL